MHFTLDTELIKKIVGIWVLAMGSVFVFAGYIDVFETPRAELESFTTFTWLLVSIILANTLPKGIWSICYIYFIVFGIFHGGLILVNSVNLITDHDTLYQISFWFNSNQTENAIHMINIAFLGFGIGAMVFSKAVKTEHNVSPRDEEYNRRLYHIGGGILVVFIVLFFLVAFATGAIYSYGAYLRVVDSNPLVGIMFTYIYVFISLALVLVAVAHDKAFGYLYFAFFAVWALFAFKLGLRGEVMFPSAVTACMLGRKGRVMNGFLLLAMIVIFLVAAGIVKNARVSGTYDAGADFNPLNAVAEMGSSLRAVQEVISWREKGDDLLLGASYWAPIERQFALFIPQLDRVKAEDDDRLLNVKVIKVAGPIGFSPVAEAYVNFGEKGVLIIFFLFGGLMAKLDNMPSSTKTDILIGVALAPLFIMIRNSFAHVPVQIIFGCAFAMFFMFLAHKRKE